MLKNGKSQINIHSLWDTQNPHWSLQIDSCNLDLRLASHLAWTFPWPGPRLFRVASIKIFNFSFRRKICIKNYNLLQLYHGSFYNNENGWYTAHVSLTKQCQFLKSNRSSLSFNNICFSSFNTVKDNYFYYRYFLWIKR